MTTSLSRSYNCKDEELPVICKFAAFSLKRDLADFGAYSPKFSAAYADEFESKTVALHELIVPKSETIELKVLTERLYKTFAGLTLPINHLAGYIELAGEGVNISATDFGLTALRKGIAAKDAESVIKNLQTVLQNIAKYKDALTAQGLPGNLAEQFTAAMSSIAADKQRHFEITSHRKKMVQNNTTTLNEAYKQFNEILKIGKILYKTKDPARLNDYTFRELKKQVRRTVNNGSAAVAKNPAPLAVEPVV